MSFLQKRMFKTKVNNLHTFHNKDYEPVSWTKYFSERKIVTINEDSFYLYTQGNEGPLLVLLHGGGYSALTWAQFTKSISSLVTCQVMALDLRGHGSTSTKDDDDLSIQTLITDVANILESISNNRPVIIIGHSLGGAIAVRSAPLITNIVGVVIIDVVEGTAMEALRSMQSFLNSRPSAFYSISHAIEWCFRSGQIRNINSAKVSVPGQIKSIRNNTLGVENVESEQESENVTEKSTPRSGSMGTIVEGHLSTSSFLQEPTEADLHKYTWRVDLIETRKYWGDWFDGLSSAFLEISAPKLLLLAKVDRLDRELTVGHMQGKFQLQILTACGHAVQEDSPDQLARVVSTFLIRHKFAKPTLNFTWPIPT